MSNKLTKIVSYIRRPQRIIIKLASRNIIKYDDKKYIELKFIEKFII